MSENKNSFFSLTLDTIQFSTNPYQLEKLDDFVDLIFSTMKVQNNWYKFCQKNNQEIIYFFKTEDRKRKGQLVNCCDKIFPKVQEYSVEALSKISYEKDINRFKKNENFKLIYKPLPFGDYSANDISIFKDPKNWHPWQQDLYNLVFNKDGSFRDPHPRHIISLVDIKGCSGKSTWFKYWYFKHPEDIGRMGYGSASQLRAGAVNLGKKKLYIVDLARSKSVNDREEDLLSVLEDIKNGLVSNAMYGSGKTLMMEPPHIIVCSNYVLKYNLLSEDRWQVFEITSANKLRKKDAKKFKEKSNFIKK